MKLDLGNWHDDIGTSAENSPNREAPNRHEKGSRAYKEWVHKDTERIDKYSNLPFTFGRPKKTTQYRRDVHVMCTECTKTTAVNKYTCGYVCNSCNKYISVAEDNCFSNEEEYEALLERFGTHKDDQR
jgi:hypothetical protein